MSVFVHTRLFSLLHCDGSASESGCGFRKKKCAWLDFRLPAEQSPSCRSRRSIGRALV